MLRDYNLAEILNIKIRQIKTLKTVTNERTKKIKLDIIATW